MLLVDWTTIELKGLNFDTISACLPELNPMLSNICLIEKAPKSLR